METVNTYRYIILYNMYLFICRLYYNIVALHIDIVTRNILAFDRRIAGTYIITTNCNLYNI